MRRHIRRGGKLLGASLAVGLLAGFAPAQAADDGSRPGGAAAIPGAVGQHYTPEALRGDEQVKVILELSGKSVGQRLSEAGEGLTTMSKKQRRALAADVKRGHRPTERKVADKGGAVLHSYEYVFNGLSVQVERAKLDELSRLPDVEDVHAVELVELSNGPGVQYIGGDTTWQRSGFTGEGVTVGVIDTGVDYTHANFGGPGNPAAFENNNGKVIEDGTFPTEKVVGGYDFVGDKYDASKQSTSKPQPDPDPLDCQGHGSHVAGTTAGMGVLANGQTYDGPYGANTHEQNDFEVAPGVAPNAKIYAYRVFGCSGSASEDVIVAAMDRAMSDGVDVVNMSLGSPFGRPNEPTAVAANTLSKAGVTVVASSGNSGDSAYITGAAAIASRAISVAAMDASSPTYPGADLELSTGETVTVQNSNGAEFQDGTTLPVKVLRAPDGSVGLGCEKGDYQNVEGKLVVTQRGTCARVHRAIYGQQAGAAAVAMINDAPGYPPFEGEINEDPITGEKVDVTIPFFGVKGAPAPDGETLAAADGGTATLTATTVPNPGYAEMAAFSSAGPRSVDSQLKPDITAPGVSVQSTAIGTGTEGRRLSGTSMAAPMTAGSAALVADAHGGWSPAQIKAALMSTAEAGPEKLTTYDVRRAGAGVVQVRKAVTTQAIARTSGGRGSLSFEYEPLAGAYSEAKTVTLANKGDRALTYDLAASFNGPDHGAGVEVAPGTVTVPAGETTEVEVTLSMSEAAVAGLPSVSTASVGVGDVLHIKGAVTATPQQTGAGIYELRVPFLVVPRGLSEVEAGETSRYETRENRITTSVPLTNRGVHAGAADIYAWGIADSRDSYRTMDVRSAGVQSLPGKALGGSKDDRTLRFAVNTYGRWSNASITEFDVLIDTTGGHRPEYVVIGADVGLVLAGAPSGEMGAFVVDAKGKNKNTIVAARYTQAPMNGSTLLLPLLASEVGLSGEDTSFTYTVNAFSLVPSGNADTTPSAVFDSHRPALSSGRYVPLAPGEKAEQELSVRIDRFVRAPALGWLAVSINDANGGAQADRIPVFDDSGSGAAVLDLPQPQLGRSAEPGVVPEPGRPQN